MKNNEELTIKQLKNIIKDLEDDLELYLELKQINYNKIQPQSTRINDVVVSKSHNIIDRFAQYKIMDEEYDSIIIAKHKSLLAYQQRLLNKIEAIRDSDSKSYITYLKEEECLTWDEIERRTHYSKRQAQRIYGNK